MVSGGKREGAGRKEGYRKENARTVRKGYRLSPEEDGELREALEKSQEVESDFVRQAIKDRCKKWKKITVR